MTTVGVGGRPPPTPPTTGGGTRGRRSRRLAGSSWGRDGDICICILVVSYPSPLYYQDFIIRSIGTNTHIGCTLSMSSTRLVCRLILIVPSVFLLYGCVCQLGIKENNDDDDDDS